MSVVERAVELANSCRESSWYTITTREAILRRIASGAFPYQCTVRQMMELTGRSYFSVYSEMQKLSQRGDGILYSFEQQIPHRYIVNRRKGSDRRRP